MAFGIFTPGASANTKVTKKVGAIVSADDDLFVVSGGVVVIEEIFGVVQTQIGALALTVLLRAVVPGTDSDLSAASASLANRLPGTLLHATTTVAALAISTGEGGIGGANQPRMVNPSTIASIVANPTTGTIDWYAVWYPVDVGAVLVAA